VRRLLSRLARAAIVAGAFAAHAQQPGEHRMIAITVTMPFIERARLEAELDHLVRKDLNDAHEGIVDVRTRRAIKALCLKLENED
jgi:hypothetical protein